MLVLIKKFVIIGLFISSFMLLSKDETATKSTLVNFILGKAHVKRENSSNWEVIKKGDKLNQGDSVKTGNGSKLTLVYKGSEFKIFPNTTIVLKSLYDKKQPGEVTVADGSVWFKLVNLNGQKFQASTPTSTAGVRGTQFSAFYDKKTKTTMNCVCEGKIVINDSTTITKGSGGKTGHNKEVEKSDYKEDIKGSVAYHSFKTKVKKYPILSNCLSCHKPNGWNDEETIKDESY